MTKSVVRNRPTTTMLLQLPLRFFSKDHLTQLDVYAFLMFHSSKVNGVLEIKLAVCNADVYYHLGCPSQFCDGIFMLSNDTSTKAEWECEDCGKKETVDFPVMRSDSEWKEPCISCGGAMVWVKHVKPHEVEEKGL